MFFVYYLRKTVIPFNVINGVQISGKANKNKFLSANAPTKICKILSFYLIQVYTLISFPVDVRRSHFRGIPAGGEETSTSENNINQILNNIHLKMSLFLPVLYICLWYKFVPFLTLYKCCH